MPRTKELPMPKKLLNLSSTKVSEIIHNFSKKVLEQPKFSIVKIMEGNGNCALTAAVRQDFILPEALEQQILETSLNFLNNSKPYADMPENSRTRTRLGLLLHYFCIGRNREWKFVLNPNRDVCLSFILLQENRNLRELEISEYINAVTLEKILMKMTNLKTLSLARIISEDELSVVGKFGCDLIELHLLLDKYSREFTISTEMAKKLCFEDDANAVKNPICSSLQYLKGWLVGEARLIILQNMANLKLIERMGDHPDYNEIVADSEKLSMNVFPCCLEDVKVTVNESISTGGIVEDVFRDFPNLKHLTLKRNRLQGENDIIHSQSEVDLLLFGVPGSNPSWGNLTSLFLYIDVHYNVCLDFSLISCNTPNLKYIYVAGCKQKEVNEFTPFQNLHKLFMEEFDSILLQHVSSKLKILGFLAGVHQENIILEFFQVCAFLVLEVLMAHMKDADLPKFLEQFPSLSTYATWLPLDDEQKLKLEMEREKRNWDLKILHDVKFNDF